MSLSVFLANPGYKIPLNKKYEKYFIKAGSRWPHSGVKKKGTIPHYLPFPIQLGHAAAWLKNEGFDVHVMDCVALDVEEKELLAAIERIRPRIFFYETTTPTIEFDLALAQKVKSLNPETLVIAGGAHGTVHAKDILEKNPPIDVVIRGEYEETLLNISQAYQNGTAMDPILGISFRKDGQVIENANAPLIDPIEKMPDPAYDLFPATWKQDPTIYWDGFVQHRPAIQMNASRGCPYTCDFCLWIQVMYRNGKYRVFPPQRTVAEMKRLKEKYGVREFYFDDDDFSIRKKHVAEFCQEILKQKLKVRWSCMADAINLNDETLKLMAESGCVGIKFGVETGSERLVKSLGKPVNLTRVKEIVNWCSKYGIKTHATFNLGLYGEDRETIEETFDYMAGLDVDTLQVSLCTPFPGTAFHKKAVADGSLQADTDWMKFDGKSSEIVAHASLPMKEMDTMRRRAMIRWFFHRMTSPFWLWKQARYSLRLVNGLGIPFIFEQGRGLLTDEFLLPSSKAS